MRRHAKAPSAGSISGSGTTRARKSLFGMACLCVVALTAFLGSGAPTAGAAEESCPNAEFRTGPGANLPECRAYEQVSPVDKNGGDISGIETIASLGTVRVDSVASSGDAALFQALTEFAGAPGGGNTGGTKYFAHRSGAGWTTEPMIPAATPPAAGGSIILSSANLERSLLSSTGLLQSDPPDLFDADQNLYMRDNAAGTVSPFVAITKNSSLPTILFFAAVAAPDLSHAVFATPSNDVVAPTPPGMPEGAIKVYEIADGEARLVSYQPDGTPFQTDALPGGASTSASAAFSTIGAVSEDGRHIFFTAGADIYRRSDATTTALASPTKRVPPDPGSPQKRFKFASPDGNRLLFTSAARLTDDANTYDSPSSDPGDLYRYDFQADELIDITAPTAGDAEANVLGVMGAGEDAERVYYVATGQVLAGEGTAGQPNLYLWEDDGSAAGATRFIATLAPSVSSDNPGDSRNWFRLGSAWTARATADGGQLAFQAVASIPGHESGGVQQVYRYDAEANGGAGQLDCVSCNPDEETPLGSSYVSTHVGQNATQRWELPRFLSADGRRVFFTSQDDLLAADTNGKFDAYLWKDGQVHLLSTGSNERDSAFFNASVDGSDAFIITAEALVPQDGDDLADLYTAHVDGGLASQFATPLPGCSGEECRSQGTQPPAGQGPATASFSGPGNPVSPKPPKRCGKGKRRVRTRGGKTRCVKRKGAKRNNRKNRANSNRRASR